MGGVVEAAENKSTLIYRANSSVTIDSLSGDVVQSIEEGI